MSEPFYGQIKPVGYKFAPVDWSTCDGQQLSIQTNQALYSLLGSTYGGNERTYFNLPDFRGRAPINRFPNSPSHSFGVKGGAQYHTLSVDEMPSHTHTVMASTDTGNTPIPASSTLSEENQFATVGGADLEYYSAPNQLTSLAPNTVTNSGSGKAYSIVQPTSVLLFIIALDGIYPARN
ncbi:phage tail protein [Shewanella sp. 10N.286.45.A1]|uniref:phage tail protein n=1 Tax=Shewanella sp. 10N.286.45.A1 TaxID=3229694 RepID=UPI003552F17D